MNPGPLFVRLEATGRVSVPQPCGRFAVNHVGEYSCAYMLGDLANVAPGMGAIGRSPAARPGPWELSVVESADIESDRIVTSSQDLRTIQVLQSSWTERQLLRPFDILVTARSRKVKAALVPAHTTRTVAAATLLVVRVAEPSSGLAHYLWYFLTSARGRALVEGQVRQGVTIPTLSASALAAIPLPLPDAAMLRGFPRLVDAAVAAHDAALEAARIRHDTIRDAIVEKIGLSASEEGTWH